MSSSVDVPCWDVCEVQTGGVMATSGYGDLVLLRRLLRQVQPYWALITASFLLSLLAGPLALLIPLPLQIAVDSAVGSRPLPDVLIALLPAARRSEANV